jgi:hypothetical protein
VESSWPTSKRFKTNTLTIFIVSENGTIPTFHTYVSIIGVHMQERRFVLGSCSEERSDPIRRAASHLRAPKLAGLVTCTSASLLRLSFLSIPPLTPPPPLLSQFTSSDLLPSPFVARLVQLLFNAPPATLNLALRTIKTWGRRRASTVH